MAPAKTDVDFLAAVIEGDLKKVAQLLDSGVSPNSVGWSVNAHMAAKEYKDDDGEEFFDKDETPGNMGMATYAITAAVQTHNLEICRLLIDSGADVNVRHGGDAGRSLTPLMFAADLGNLPIVQLLVDKGCDVLLFDDLGRTAVFHAVIHGHTKVLEFLQSHIEKLPIEMSLADAATNGQTKRVLALLKAGAKPDEVDRFGLTPLKRACTLNFEAIVDALLKAGANHSLGSNFKAAKEKSLLKFVEHWSVYFVKPKGKDSICTMSDIGALVGEPPILVACVNGYHSIVKKLLKAGCDVNIESRLGKVTPLMMAIKGEDLELVKFLLESGASLAARDGAKASPLDWALHMKRVTLGSEESFEIINLLREKLGTKVEKVDYKKVWKQFREVEATPEFQKVIAYLSKECQTKPYPWRKRKGVQRFYVKNWDALAKKFGKPTDYVKNAAKGEKQDRKDEIAYLLQDKVREQGFLLVSHKDEEGSAMQLLFPTQNKFEAIAACGTDGYNHGFTNDDVIEKLKEIDEQYPFILTDCMHDAVGGRLVKPLKNAKELASTLCSFCNDLVDGDLVKSDKDVEKHIEKTQRFYLWWD